MKLEAQSDLKSERKTKREKLNSGESINGEKVQFNDMIVNELRAECKNMT